MSEFKRVFKLDISENNAFFLWGPRKVGKTTYLKDHFPKALWIDLLNTRDQTDFSLHPYQLRERVLSDHPELIIIDEIQKVPRLLDEVHWCLENTKTKFILCGSSARKLKRGAANLLGGRAWRSELFPLTTAEIPDFDLIRAINHGLIPQHYKSQKPDSFLKGYVLDYLHEEIQMEAKIRQINAFERFLDMIAKSHGQLINYANIARDCGVSGPTIRSYFQILEDTLLGFRLPPWKESKSRRLIETEKFYLFDVGLVRFLQGSSKLEPGTDLFGRAFEHFILQEIRTYLSYKDKNMRLTYWRTSTNLEVDLIVGNMIMAIECKASRDIRRSDVKGLCALMEDHKIKYPFVVSLDTKRRKLENGILIVPWKEFFNGLWNNIWLPGLL